VLIPFIAFLIDIILTLNTSFYLKGALIDGKSSILNNYRKHNLWLDILTISPMCFSVVGWRYKLVEITFFFRIIKL